MLNEVLRVQLINGVRSKNLNKLLAVEYLSFDDHVKKALTHEQVERDFGASLQPDLPTSFQSTNFVHKLI